MSKISANAIWLLIKIIIGGASFAASIICIMFPVMHAINGIAFNTYFFVGIVMVFICTTVGVFVYSILMSTIAHLIRGKR